jgi:asparagine synthase (glutamine-hydrolysing)
VCGIAGIISRTDNSVTQQAIEAMTVIIKHRGPDGYGYYRDNKDKVAFGHRRLAILDLTPDGHQPMHYDQERYTITYNGEIYNYLEIRDELRSKGYAFRSQTDTEVILAAYMEWGQACVVRFNGMWSFAIHDKVNNIVFCSRDRFGVKPFYYHVNADIFAFGSELKQLLPLMSARKANKEILTNFLFTGICEHTTATFFEGIEKLPASHNLIYDLANHTFSIEAYYRISRVPTVENLPLEEAQELFSSVFQEAIRLRLRSDVKVGTCLSGGLDSSSVATIAARLTRQATVEPFCAITAVSTQESNDESRFAEIVAKHSSMNWLTVRPTYEDFLVSLENVVYAQEEPFSSPSITMQYYVMKTARENGITVLLDGQGGDETLLGYERYYAAHLVSLYKREGLLAIVASIWKAGKNNTKLGFADIMKYLVSGLSAQARYIVYSSRHCYLKEIPPLPKHLQDFSRCSLDIFALQVLENTSSNLPALLRYEDKNSMAHSIETRLPFLDYRMLETSLSLPGEYKLNDGWTKWILRNSMVGKMPDSVVWRKNKFGFEAPEKQWLMRHLQTMQRVVGASPILQKTCDMGRLMKMFPNMDMRSQWRLYSTAMWEKIFEVVD